MKIKRKAFVLMEIILAVTVFTMAYFMVWEKSGREEEKIAVLISNPDDSRWNAFKYGLQMAAEDQKVEISLIPMKKNPSVDAQKQAIEQEIGRGADGVILEPASGRGAEEMLVEMGKQIPLMLIAPGNFQEGNQILVTTPDDEAMGEALGREVLRDFNEKMKGKTVGVICENPGLKASQKRIEGIRKVVEEAGGQILWKDHSLEGHSAVNVVFAVDDASVVNAGGTAAANNLHGALVYGIGNSMEAVHYLDTGSVECLAIPDDFLQGYQSLTQMAKALKHSFSEAEDTTIDYKILRRGELFLEENQEILYTMSQ